MSKVALASIKSLTFYSDGLTTARRTEPIPQLNCIGKACDLYMPDVVRCTNAGGHGNDVDWKCEADLPEALRFGRVEVSCEGWSAPGDAYVLKGSCALNYRLVQVPDALREQGERHGMPSRLSRWTHGMDITGTVFMLIWCSIVAFVLYNFLKSCWRRQPDTLRAGNRPARPDTGSGWFPGTYHDDVTRHDPPPPYSKTSSSSQSGGEGWRPGFWSGAALGGLGTYLWSNAGSRDAQTQRMYDWERRRTQMNPPPFTTYTTQRRTYYEDRGEGSSSGLGSMRRSTGLGGSNVR